MVAGWSGEMGHQRMTKVWMGCLSRRSMIDMDLLTLPRHRRDQVALATVEMGLESQRQMRARAHRIQKAVSRISCKGISHLFLFSPIPDLSGSQKRSFRSYKRLDGFDTERSNEQERDQRHLINNRILCIQLLATCAAL